MNWHVVQTKPRQEKFAEMNIQRLGIETFLPLLKEERRAGGERKQVVQPLFPAYLFVRFEAGLSYRAVNFAQGVRYVVTFGNTPAVVDESMIEQIRSKQRDGYVTIQRPSFSPGERVRIQNGHFSGLEAVFEREMDDRQRGLLLLKALSYQAHLIVDLQDVVNF